MLLFHLIESESFNMLTKNIRDRGDLPHENVRMRDLPCEKEKCEREGEKETGLVENPPPLHSYLILIKNFRSTTKANAALREIPSNVTL